MRKTTAVATMAASLALGGLAGTVLGTPTLAGAAQTATGAVSWVQEALSGLVGDGTITQEQADRVESALEQARPERGFDHHRFGGHIDLSVVAETVGLSEGELDIALRDGQTVADVAGERGVDVRDVIDAIVAVQRERLDEEVADGDLTQEQADEVLADTEERATAIVNGDVPAVRGGPHGDFGGHRDIRRAPEGGDTNA